MSLFWKALRTLESITVCIRWQAKLLLLNLSLNLDAVNYNCYHLLSLLIYISKRKRDKSTDAGMLQLLWWMRKHHWPPRGMGSQTPVPFSGLLKCFPRPLLWQNKVIFKCIFYWKSVLLWLLISDIQSFFFCFATCLLTLLSFSISGILRNSLFFKLSSQHKFVETCCSFPVL